MCVCVCVQCILSMFEDMGFINSYKIDMHTLARSDRFPPSCGESKIM